MTCAAAANIACGKYLAAVLLAPLVVDISGTAQILFITTKQFESAILTDGRDVTSLILVRTLVGTFPVFRGHCRAGLE